LKVIERGPGWHGRIFYAQSMTFAHDDFAQGSSVNEHCHPEQEVWQVVEGTLEITIDGVSQVAGPGWVAIVPPNVLHSVKAITRGKAIVVNHPLRDNVDRSTLVRAASDPRRLSTRPRHVIP
jgi:quercetin dioxygenase-like cupin family protein